MSICGEAVRRTHENGKGRPHMAKYAFLFIDDGVDYQGSPTPEQQKVYADIFKWFETNGGRIVDGGAELQPTQTATTIRTRGDKRVVLDGPFIEAKESVGGFTIFDLESKDEAVALAKTWPGHGVEIRPVREG
ncbi:MAG: hypothetical protein E6G64_15930 [Actinobacteria bacterium]|nr:MAG: hypothetical protein E6G64_15930 [Actinomycetota bacterium]